MNEKQTSAMIKSAATSTDIRKNKIMDAVRIAFLSLGFYTKVSLHSEFCG
jgi:hypothetical protein